MCIDAWYMSFLKATGTLLMTMHSFLPSRSIGSSTVNSQPLHLGKCPACLPRTVCAMASKSPLIVVGSVNADLVLPIERLPKPGETLGAASMDTLPGGKGANQAAAAARLGYPTYFAGQIGTDANAPLLKDALQHAGVNLQYLKDIPGPTGTALILLQKSGENSIIIVGGANQAPWELNNDLTTAIKGCGAILLQREIPESVNLQVSKIASEAGVPVFLDAGGVEAPLSPELCACLTVLSPNETELARLTGMPTDNQQQIEAAAAQLQSMGVKNVLVKLGADGSLLLPGGEQWPIRQKALPANSVVDTTGAGDCFTAAYAVAVMEGKQGAEALRFASAAACLCVQKLGAMPSMPSRQEVEELLAKHA